MKRFYLYCVIYYRHQQTSMTFKMARFLIATGQQCGFGQYDVALLAMAATGLNFEVVCNE